MNKKSLVIKEALGYGLKRVKENLGFFIIIIITAFLIRFIPQLIVEAVSRQIDKTVVSPQLIITTIVLLIFSLAVWVVEVVIGMGLMRIPLKIYDGVKPEFSDLFSCFPLFFKYLGGMFLYMLIVLGGTLLLIVPGVIWAVKFSMYPMLIVDKGMGPVAALKKSAQITQGVKGKLLLFWLSLVGVNILGLLALVVGLVITAPTTMLAGVFAYRKLAAQTDA